MGHQSDMCGDRAKQLEQERIALAYQQSVAARRQQRDGVVVTPCEVVDFQIRSTIEAVKQQYGRAPDEGIEWLDPFGGTGIYTARLLQLAPLSPERKRRLAANCAVIEIDREAAQLVANNLAAVYEEECGVKGFIHVVCADTFSLPPDVCVWDLPCVMPSGEKLDG